MKYVVLLTNEALNADFLFEFPRSRDFFAACKCIITMLHSNTVMDKIPFSAHDAFTPFFSFLCCPVDFDEIFSISYSFS